MGRQRRDEEVGDGGDDTSEGEGGHGRMGI
jgi:hypothetical protein